MPMWPREIPVPLAFGVAQLAKHQVSLHASARRPSVRVKHSTRCPKHLSDHTFALFTCFWLSPCAECLLDGGTPSCALGLMLNPSGSWTKLRLSFGCPGIPPELPDTYLFRRRADTQPSLVDTRPGPAGTPPESRLPREFRQNSRNY